MRLDGQLAKRQPEASTDSVRIELAELLEDPRERFGWNAFAGVANGKADGLVVVLSRADRHDAASRELEGVADEVDQRPRQLLRIAGERRQAGGDFRGQRIA